VNQPVLLVTGADLAPQALALLQDFEVIYAGKTPQPLDVIALCQKHNPVACIVRYGQWTAAMMDAAPALRVISKHGSGIDTIDKAAAAQRGIAVVAASGANAAAVAEQAAAMLLACAKSTVVLNARMHAGHWDKATHKSLELSGLTVGLIGLGTIGQRFARICAALDMRVIGYDPFAKDVAHVQSTLLEAIWKEADVISLHCPLTPENHQLINPQTLSQCKRGVILINTARGGLVDEAALLAAVESGQVGMAALDSFAHEPFAASHIFQGHPRLLLSPHIGGVSSAAYVNMGVAAAQNVLKALKETQ
jgi:D-3-phosphoglycerate dehydrogenase / 2-oxoglutarate reductase